jgi:hypothetical protein
MKKIILFVAMAVVAMSIYSCQKDHSVKPKATIGTLSKAKKILLHRLSKHLRHLRIQLRLQVQHS